MNRLSKITLFLCIVAFMGPALAEEQTPLQPGQNHHRNMAVPAKDLPDHLGPDNQLWQVQLQGDKFFNLITIEGNRAYCGMNAKNFPSKPRTRNSGVLCLDITTGEVIWESELTEGAGFGLADIPLLDEDHVYVRVKTPFCLDKETGEIVWSGGKDATPPYRRTMHGPNGTGLLIGDYWWLPTSAARGADGENWWSNALEIPHCPSIVVLEKKTGKIVAQDQVEVGPHQHGQWASISSAVVDGQRLVFFGDAHGILHAYKAPETFEGEGVATLEEVWWCDANPKDYRVMEDGTPMPYKGPCMMGGSPNEIGWCEVIGAPAYYDGLLYVTIGRDKAYSAQQGKKRIGNGAVTCIDPRGTGDITDTNKVWIYTQDMNRTFSTPSVTEDYVFVDTHAGFLHCINRKTGEQVWRKDINACSWNWNQIVGDGKVFTLNEEDDFYIIKADDSGEVLFHALMDGTNNPTPGLTNGILVVGTVESIAGYGGPEYMKTHKPMATPPEHPQVVEVITDEKAYLEKAAKSKPKNKGH